MKLDNIKVGDKFSTEQKLLTATVFAVVLFVCTNQFLNSLLKH
jgi:hypothetical protein